MDRIVTTRGNMPIKSSGAQSFINTAHFNALTKELAMLVSRTIVARTGHRITRNQKERIRTALSLGLLLDYDKHDTLRMDDHGEAPFELTL